MFKFQPNGFQNYIDAWNEVFKKPVDASKFADFLDNTDIQSLIGLTDTLPKNDNIGYCAINNDNSTLYTLKSTGDKYYRVYLNDKEILTEYKFINANILGNIIYVQRESDNRWNGINRNGNLIWGDWALSVKPIISGDIFVHMGEDWFFLVDENGVPIGNEFPLDAEETADNEVEDNEKDIPSAANDENCQEEDEYDVEMEDYDESEDDIYEDDIDEDTLIKECGSDTLETKLRHFYAEKLPEIKRELVDTATELAEMFCEDIFQGICNELTGSPDLYWDIESNNFPIIPDEDDDKSGGTPARDVVSAEEPTKPQEVSDENIKNVSKTILKDTEAKMDEMARAFIRKEIEELLNKKQNKTANLVSSDENWKPTPNWRDWFRSDTRQFS